MVRFAGILATLVLTMSAATVRAQVDGPTVNWRVATYPPPRASTTAIHTIADYVKQQTGGKFAIEIGYGTYGDPKDFLDLLKIGSIHGALVQTAITGGKLPLYTVLDLPFLPLGDVEVQQAVHEAVHEHPAILEEFAAWNAKPFMSSLIPQYELTGKGEAPSEPGDLTGLRVRAQGELGNAIEKLGATATTIPAPEVYVALDRGLVSAVAQPFYAIQSYKLGEVADWMTTNLSLGTTGVPLVFSLDAWDELPSQYQQLLEEAREIAYERQKEALGQTQQKAHDALVQELEPIQFSEDKLAAFREAGGKPVWEEWVSAKEEEGLAGREVLDLVLKTAEQAPTE